MAISIFPSTAAEFVSNNFVVDMNDTSNNTADTGGVKQAGPYSISFSSGDSSFDVYLIDEDGNSVGYSNNTSIVASGLFSTVVILGVAQDEVVSFLYQGSVNNADGEGDEPGAGAYLESISPSDLPTIDDTATVVGGNFGADTEITFESGATVLPAKNIVVTNSTELVVTRPDELTVDEEPYTVRAVNTGIPEPSGSNANLLTDAVTAGATPVWVTTSPLTQGTVGQAYSETLEATDAEGDVTYSITTGSLPTGLSLDSATGVISGTPTSAGTTFTATATDDGGNSNNKEFTIPLVAASGGTQTSDNDFFYHTFLSTDDFTALTDLDVEYLIVAGGGSAKGNPNFTGTGGGGAGGLLNGTTTVTAGTFTATVGAGGIGGSNGSDSVFAGVTALGGGFAGSNDTNPAGGDGGSGGGASGSGAGNFSGGSGTAGQGFDGGDSQDLGTVGDAGGGGGAGEQGGSRFTGNAAKGGDGLQFLDWANATSTGVDNGYYAGGAAGSRGDFSNTPGLGGGGFGATGTNAGAPNTGGGSNSSTASGGSGIVIVRYAK